MTAPAKRPAAHAISYRDLYARWERGNWRATEIDFTQDAVDWRERMSEDERAAALVLFTLFFHGEDEVADDLSPFVMAAPTEEATYFLTTQQVDEARHAVFFTRFLAEVAGVGDGEVGTALEATAPGLTWGHQQLFANLATVSRGLLDDASPARYAEAVTTYMIIVEGALAQPGQHLIERWLERTGLLPGFLTGLRHVAEDELRHIAFGMKTLADLHADAPDEIAPVILDVVRRTIPWMLFAAYPDDGDSRWLEPLGERLDALYADALRSLRARLTGIGIAPELQADVLPSDPDGDDARLAATLVEWLDDGRLDPMRTGVGAATTPGG